MERGEEKDKTLVRRKDELKEKGGYQKDNKEEKKNRELNKKNNPAAEEFDEEM